MSDLTECAVAEQVPSLHLVRLPSEFGPTIRCLGSLTVATMEGLRRELDLLIPLGHPVLTLNLTNCRALDSEGALLLLDTHRRLLRSGRKLVLVAAREPASRLLELLGMDRYLLVFPTEGAAMLALRSGGPAEPATATWDAARRETLAAWEQVATCLRAGMSDAALREATAPQALCRRAAELAQNKKGYAEGRCRLCPLFYALGGRPENLGCQTVQGPLLAAIEQHDPDRVLALADRMVATLRELSDHHLA